MIRPFSSSLDPSTYQSFDIYQLFETVVVRMHLLKSISANQTIELTPQHVL